MNAKISQKLLCFITTILLLLSGMCFDTFETDSSFAYNSETAFASALTSGENTLTDSQSCTLEMLGQHAAITTSREIRPNSNRSTTKLSLSFSILRGLPSIFTPAFCAVSFLEYPEIFSITTIIQYIHREDGKK